MVRGRNDFGAAKGVYAVAAAAQTNRPEFYPLALTLEGVDLTKAPWQVREHSKKELVLHWAADGLEIERVYTPGSGPYQLEVTTSVVNRGSKSRRLELASKVSHYVPRSDEEGGIPFLPVRSPWTSQGLCRHAEGDLAREDRNSLTDETERFGQASFVGTENVYFLAAEVTLSGPADTCVLEASDRGRDSDGDPLGTLFTSTMRYPARDLGAGERVEYKSLAYLGPKTPESLEQAGHGLPDAIDGGWFGGVSKFLTVLLRYIHDVVNNWGMAIILLTFIVKSLLYPLTAKQMKSMARMKELKPEIDRINQLYPDDREKKGAAMMELYREKGVNPMAGCFPMLVQLPIWFSLYSSLSTNIELFHAPFVFWLTDLSTPDPYFVLPLALGGLMFVQQKLTPTAGADPVQQRTMLYMMPTMMTAFMLFLPAGLCLYMFTNSALSIGQQKLIEHQIAKGPVASPSQDSISTSSSSTPMPAGGASPGETSRRPKPARLSKAERRSRRGK